MRAINLKPLLILTLMLGISGCQTGPKTELVDSGIGTETTQQEDVLAAFALEDEGAWIEAAEAYQVLAQKYSQPEKSSFYIKAGLMLYKVENY